MSIARKIIHPRGGNFDLKKTLALPAPSRKNHSETILRDTAQRNRGPGVYRSRGCDRYDSGNVTLR